MAKGNNGNAKNASQSTEKVVTKYDLKMQRRAEELRKEKRNRKIARVTTVVVLAAFVITLVASIWTNYYRVNVEYIKVNDESVSQTEFDWYYGMTKASVINTYGSYLSYLYGYDSSKSDKTQNYSDTQTWYDYFSSMTVDSIKTRKALLKIADEKNFDYTTYDADLDEYNSELSSAASDSSLTVDEYYSTNFSKNVTAKKVEKYIYDYLKSNAVRDLLTEELAATDSEIDSYYSQNKSDYDTVDYRTLAITATDTSDSASVTAASDKAQAMLAAITDEASFNELCAQYSDDADTYKNDKDASLVSGYSYSSSEEELGTWLFDDSRKAGDKNVIEDSSNGKYTVVYFVSRTNGKDSNKDTIAQSVLSEKYQEYLEGYTTDMSYDVKNRIVME